ncbi:MAG TPA: hypothetical protein VEC95_09220 [Terriglobales bacterium]|nr:hypothetical protein [Terriglobales bacterium]
MVASPYTSRFYRLLISVGVGALIMAGEFVGEFLLRHALHAGWREPQLALASNTVGGIVGALLVYKLLSFEAERERLRQELNHKIRNALQPISYCTPNLNEPEGSLIEASVAQIETCLRESLLTEMLQPWGAPRRKQPQGQHVDKA